MPAAEGAGTLTALTPQVPPPSAEEMADVEGTPKYDLSRKIFDAELDSLKACVGTGTITPLPLPATLRVNNIINFRGSLFSCGQRCFAPLGRYGDPCFGAAKRRRAKILRVQQGNGTIWLNSVSTRLCRGT